MRSLAVVVVAIVLAAPAQDRTSPWSPVVPGVEHATVPGGSASGDAGSGRVLAVHALRIDPRLVDLRIVHALDRAVGLETVSSIAARHGAIAAVNGGFFRTTGTYRGDSLGALMIDGELLSETDRGRAVVAVARTSEGAHVTFSHAMSASSITAGGATATVNGLNRPRGAGELIVFTPQFHATTLTTPDGVEAVVRRGRVERLVDPGGSQTIPLDGLVISGHGGAAAWLRQHARPRARVRLAHGMMPVDTADAPWTGARDMLGAGPQIVKLGRVDITAEREQMSVSLSTERHPRTAIGTMRDGRVIVAVVDGRRPGWSDGMLLEELAALMLGYGAFNAINLDGGGSSTMVLQGSVMNRPSDAAGERPVSDAILVLPRKR